VLAIASRPAGGTGRSRLGLVSLPRTGGAYGRLPGPGMPLMPALLLGLLLLGFGALLRREAALTS
jgi:hypothetical protein